MKKTALINQPLSAVIAGLGHMDMLVIGDAGLPIPPGPERIDLALTENLPRFMDVVKLVAGEMQVERVILASETLQRSPQVHEALRQLFGDIPFDTPSHEEFKQLTRTARAVVRTGEFTPYANVILVAGVVY